MPIATINPATGQTIRTFTEMTGEEIDAAVERAARAFADYRHTSFTDRSRWMFRAAEILDGEKNDLGRLMALEMGKPVAAGNDEAAKCARACRFYAANAERFMSEEEIKTDAARSFVRYEAMGVVLAVMPWNFPFWQVMRFAAPALMAGNVGLLKHASNVPQCALALEDIFRRAGFPHGVFQVILAESSVVASLLADPRIAAATLTGSEGAGSAVAATAGKHIKKTVLELGGSDPFIVLPSADLDLAISTAVKARTVNSGQSCIAAKRFIVHEAIAEQFEPRFVRAMADLVIGDPMDPATEVGPLATPDILRDLESQVRATVAAGGRVLTGGRKLDGPGNFYEPTVLCDISPDSPAAREELFGPVASLFRVKDAADALRLANDSAFGLGASVWTTDPSERELFARELQAGMVFFNAMVASDPRLPFGGVKRSGYGRELGEAGLREFVNVKTVWIA